MCVFGLFCAFSVIVAVLYLQFLDLLNSGG